MGTGTFFRNYRCVMEEIKTITLLSQGYMKRRKPSMFLNQRSQSSPPTLTQRGRTQQVRLYQRRDTSHQKQDLKRSERL